MPEAPVLPLAHARRLALHAQGLAAAPGRGTAGADDVAAQVRRLGALQLDPISAVARSPLLVLHARLGAGFREPALLEAAYQRRALFDHWAHDASMVPVEDLGLHRWQQARYLWVERKGRTDLRAWLETNRQFASAIVTQLCEHGPLRARELEAEAAEHWRWGYWTDEVSARQTMARMLQVLWLTGDIGVSDRHGTERVWDVFVRCLPPGALAAADADRLTDHEVGRRATLRALGMLGVARPTHIAKHFTRGRYPGMAQVLQELEAEGTVVRVQVQGTRAGDWWGLRSAVETAGRLPEGRRTVALSPFDNVLCDRARTAELFGFDHRLEIYVPPDQRRWGYYVLPILHGERFVARADLKLDKDARVLQVLSLHHEPGRRAPAAVRTALERLAAWRGSTLSEHVAA